MDDIDLKLPEDVVENVRQLLHGSEGYQWAVGDYLVDVLDELSSTWATKCRNPRAKIIRELAQQTGADTSTLRDRESMCRFFPPRIREKCEPLTWSQLRACKAAGPQWQEYAVWAIDNLPCPVSMIRAKIRGNGDLAPAWVSRWDRVRDLCTLLERDPQAPGWVQEICEWVANAIEPTSAWASVPGA
jgi:hypothetical protein